MAVDDDHRMRAIFVTLPAVVLDRLAGTILTGRVHLPQAILLAPACPSQPARIVRSGEGG
ncbi:MAG TPA: hypothetical protein VFZ38_07465 [Vicinamibacterales bacterium]